MSEQENNNSQDQTGSEAAKDTVIEAEAVEVKQQKTAESGENKKNFHFNNDVLTRILVTLLFVLIGWLSLWVFGVVVLVQFGFLLITGNLNKNLKAFNGELGDYLSDIIAYVGFQKDEKPFPFQAWHYDDDKNAKHGEPAQ